MEPSGSLLVLVKLQSRKLQLGGPNAAVGGRLAGAVHVIAKSVRMAPPAGTLTVRGFCPLTTQLVATSPSPTVRLPAGSPVMGRMSFIAIGWGAPSTMRVEPLGSDPAPPVVVVTVRSPVVGWGVGQLIANAAVWVPPSATVTVFEFPPVTVQFEATSVSTTVWSPDASAVTVTLLVMGSGMTSNAALVSGVRPVTVAVNVYPVAGMSLRRSEKVATPFAARAWDVPVSVAPLGWVPSATVIRLSAPATGVPLESTTATRTWLSCCPARALPGLLVKARPAGGSWDNWVPPPPVNSLSKWQLAMTVARASTKRVFIAADGRCKGRTGSTPWTGRLSR